MCLSDSPFAGVDHVVGAGAVEGLVDDGALQLVHARVRQHRVVGGALTLPSQRAQEVHQERPPPSNPFIRGGVSACPRADAPALSGPRSRPQPHVDEGAAAGRVPPPVPVEYRYSHSLGCPLSRQDRDWRRTTSPPPARRRRPCAGVSRAPSQYTPHQPDDTVTRLGLNEVQFATDCCLCVYLKTPTTH